jgi:S1-C subfamily serine protease
MLLPDGTTTWLQADSVPGLFTKTDDEEKRLTAARPAAAPAAKRDRKIPPLPSPPAHRAAIPASPLAKGPPPTLAERPPVGAPEVQHRDVLPVVYPIKPPLKSTVVSPPSTSQTRVLLAEMQKKHRRTFIGFTISTLSLIVITVMFVGAVTLWLVLREGPAQSTVKESPLTAQQIYRKTLLSTCWVGRRGAVQGRIGFMEDGSGSLVDLKRKLVLTNYHVVQRTTDVLVYFPVFRDGVEVKDPAFYVTLPAVRGKVLVSSPQTDLALIELEFVPQEIKQLPLAFGSPSPGEQVHSIGNPIASGGLWVYTNGFVRQVTKRKIFYPNQTVDARIIETQSPTNAGDSGGPVVNEKAELVGVVSGSTTNAQLQSFFIDVTEVQALLGNLPP